MAMFRRLLDRNVATLVAVVLAGELMTGVLSYALVLRPQTERIAEVTATMTGAISRAMTAMPPGQRAAMIAQFNSGDAVAIRPVAAPLSDGARYPTLVEREFMRAMARHLAPADLGGQQRLRWRTDGGARLWVDLTLGGEPYWISISPARFRGPLTSMLLALVTSVFAAIAGGVLLQRHFDRPLRDLTTALDAYGVAAPLARLDETGPEEIAAVAGALNRMAARLAEQEAERALMLAAVSHDLRTPLTRLRLSLAMMHGEDVGLTNSAGRQVDQLEAMLAQFLEFARDFASEAVVRTGIPGLLAEAVHDRGAEVTISTPPQLVAVIRPSALARGIGNLIGNAQRHGRSPICVQARAETGALVIAVTDAGEGFDPAQSAALCRPFARGDAARGGEGSGLGLAIAARIAEAHGGRLSFAQSSQGFTVSLTLPGSIVSTGDNSVAT